jgi:hypothetical protein
MPSQKTTKITNFDWGIQLVISLSNHSVNISAIARQSLR